MGKDNASTVIHVSGLPGSGETTVVRLLLEALSGLSVLVADASPDTFLGLHYGITHPVCLSALLDQLTHGPVSVEASEWALHDLPVGIDAGTETEMLCLGSLPTELTDAQQQFLCYGLPRLFATYEAVVWDGDLGILASMLADVRLETILVLTPDSRDVPSDMTGLRTKVLLNLAGPTETLPEFALAQIQQGNWEFVGKLPRIESPEERSRQLPEYFRDCIYKLNLPFLA